MLTLFILYENTIWNFLYFLETWSYAWNKTFLLLFFYILFLQHFREKIGILITNLYLYSVKIQTKRNWVEVGPKEFGRCRPNILFFIFYKAGLSPRNHELVTLLSTVASYYVEHELWWCKWNGEGKKMEHIWEEDYFEWGKCGWWHCCGGG